ncbi:hypothetical protein KCU71_g713, partial [Aureobasidium melanogenum]
MSTDALPKIRLTHDDNVVIYTKGDTTLILCTASFVLSPSSALVKTPRIVIYADTIFVGGRIECRGKSLELHCNHLQWGESTFMNFKGVDGSRIAAVGPQAGIDGQAGGRIIIHVHTLPLQVANGKLVFWPSSFGADVSGGEPGACHKSSTSTEWNNGKAGDEGKVTLYYSNPLFRGAASLLDIYALKDTLPIRLRMMQSEIASTLEPNSSIVDAWRKKILDLGELLATLLNLHATLNRCVDLITSADENDKSADLDEVSEFIKHLFTLKDYSIAYPDIQKPANDLCALLGARTDDTADKLADVVGSFQVCKISTENKLEQTKTTPLSVLVQDLWTDVWKAHKLAEKETQGHIQPSQGADSHVVSYSKTGEDDMAINVALVHPDQCQMMLRAVDAAFFSCDTAVDAASFYRNTTIAREGYNMLLQRLKFVPHLLAEKRAPAKSGQPCQPSPLHRALQEMEMEHGLSMWTTETLANTYNQVCGRLDQLAMNLDLFGLSASSAPRLSYEYHSQDAQRQLKRLGRYELSYWNFFDAYQDQMEAGWSLQESRAINVFRRKQADDEITRAMAIIKDKEIEIQKAADDLAAKRDKLQAALEAVKKDLDSWQWPSIGSTIAAVASVVIIGAFVASNPAGWVTAIMAVTAGAQQVGSLKDEMCDTIEDANGQTINKEYLINELGSCGDDVGSLLKTAYMMQNDGTKSVNENDTRKIAVTETQLQNFLKQFKDKLPHSKGENLKALLEAFSTASKVRNQNILTYNNAVISLYQQLKNKALVQNQTERLGSELLKQNQGLPSIVGYYQRLRNDARISILRAIKQSALALRFWSLRAITRFGSPSLLSNTDELEAHLSVLTQEYELSISRFGSFSQCTWPRVVSESGIFYRLSQDELDGLKLGIPDMDADGQMVYSVQVVGLSAAVTRATTSEQSPFAGRSNVRISQVRAWLPGITSKSGRRQLTVELVHEGNEAITDPDDVVFSFNHAPIHLAFEYDWRRVRSFAEMRQEAATARQVLPSDSSSGNANVRVQAAFGPFSTWRITLRESINGELELGDNVEEAYLEFCGSSFPFRR